MNLLIGTPTYNEQVTTQYMRSVLNLLTTLNAPAVWSPMRATLIPFARNALVSQTLEGGFSHLLFVDADLEFAPSAVTRMLAFDKPVVACAYPMRQMDLALVHQAARMMDDPEAAFAAALEYPAHLVQPHEAIGGFYRATHAPTGLMLIRRDALEALRDAHPELHRPAAGTQYASLENVLQVFEPLYDTNGVALGEDVSFCRRWTALGGEIWCLMDEWVGHTGPYTFRGRAAVPA